MSNLAVTSLVRLPLLLKPASNKQTDLPAKTPYTEASAGGSFVFVAVSASPGALSVVGAAAALKYGVVSKPMGMAILGGGVVATLWGIKEGLTRASAKEAVRQQRAAATKALRGMQRQLIHCSLPEALTIQNDLRAKDFGQDAKTARLRDDTTDKAQLRTRQLLSDAFSRMNVSLKLVGGVDAVVRMLTETNLYALRNDRAALQYLIGLCTDAPALMTRFKDLAAKVEDTVQTTGVSDTEERRAQLAF